MAPAAVALLLLLLPHAIVCPAIPSDTVATAGNEPKDDAAAAAAAAGSVTSAGPKDKVDQELDDLGLEYGRYLQQVVQALEADKEFSAKLENASVDAIKSGAVAEQLAFVKHDVRSKLDELKRIEVERLHRLTRREHALKQRLEHEHVDGGNPHSFEVEDLHRLILAATRDLEALDGKRRQEFKEYEMRKELEFRAALARAPNDTERVRLVQEHEAGMKRHADHPRVHHPGSKAQLQQVWQEEDHLPNNEFDPKTFFSLHDLNSDGYLDVQEVEALLSLEVRKLYDPQHNPAAEDDPREMMEEFHRMREHVYREADRDRDGLISRKEFLDLTARPDFESKDKEGWQDLGSDPSPAHKGNFDEADLARYYETMHRLQQQQPHPNDVGVGGGGAQAYYGYEHAPPPPEYYGYHPGQGAPAHLQQHPQQQQQFVPLNQQHPQQLAAAQQALHQQQQQLHHQQQQIQRAMHEQQVQYNGQVYGLPQQQQQQPPPAGVAPVAQQPPVAPHVAAQAPTAAPSAQHP